MKKLIITSFKGLTNEEIDEMNNDSRELKENVTCNLKSIFEIYIKMGYEPSDIILSISQIVHEMFLDYTINIQLKELNEEMRLKKG